MTLADKTRRLYAALEPADFSDGDTTLRTAERLERGQPLSEDELINGFERAARRVFPGLDEEWRAVERISGKRWCLSGAGPALFALAASRGEALELAARLARREASTFAVRMVKHARASLRGAAIGYA